MYYSIFSSNFLTDCYKEALVGFGHCTVELNQVQFHGNHISFILCFKIIGMHFFFPLLKIVCNLRRRTLESDDLRLRFLICKMGTVMIFRLQDAMKI